MCFVSNGSFGSKKLETIGSGHYVKVHLVVVEHTANTMLYAPICEQKGSVARGSQTAEGHGHRLGQPRHLHDTTRAIVQNVHAKGQIDRP